TAKGLANGIPIGACLARGIAAETLKPGNHGTTFGGNPFSCSVALRVMDVIEKEKLMENARKVGDYLMDRLRHRLAGLNNVKEVRGAGLMIGIELTQPSTELVAQSQARGLLINVTAEKVIRLLPPLILTQEQADTIVDVLGDIIEND
ncbi:MAG: aminotransferase class III-fold pyridoxal phosphate-dependent enzyme, partial [Gammaproteobacteria bacterium]|nr:aminotransferase class III-fold pyridoxal phosphate-dependent enzyme [Gammaproteobacteria bacterium]